MKISLYRIPAALETRCWTGIITVKKLWSSSLVSFHYSTLCNDSLRFLTVRSFSQVIANNSCWAASAAFSVFSKSISRCLHCQSHKRIPMHIDVRRTTWEKSRFKMSQFLTRFSIFQRWGCKELKTEVPRNQVQFFVWPSERVIPQ